MFYYFVDSYVSHLDRNHLLFKNGLLMFRKETNTNFTHLLIKKLQQVATSVSVPRSNLLLLKFATAVLKQL